MPTFTSTTAAPSGTNASGIGLNLGKLRSIPAGVRELPMPRQSFQTNNSQVQRAFDVPWGTQRRFLEYMLGHVSNLALPSNPRNVTFNGSSVTATTVGASATLTISGHTVTSGDVDRLLIIDSGTNFIDGTYTVASTGAGTWTLDRVATTGNGSALLGVSAGKGKLIRTEPAQHPDYPWLYAVEAELLDGIGIPGQGSVGQLYYYDGNVATDGFARYVVTYRALDYDIKTDAEIQANNLTELSRWVTRDGTYATESVELPGNSFKFSDNTPVPTGFAKLLSKQELIYIWREIPEVPESNIEACISHVNSVTFDSKYPPETLLLEGAHKRRYRSTTGHVWWEVAYRFIHRPQGWNKYFRRNAAGGPRFEAVLANDGSLRKPYDTVDFAKLFQVPYPT